MAALNSAALDFDDAPTSTRVVGEEFASPQNATTNRSRRPNVPNISGAHPSYQNLRGTATAIPPRPLSNVGVGSLPAALNARKLATLPISPRSRRNPLLAVTVPHPIVLVAGLLAVMVLGFLLLSNMLQWWQTWQDDLTYGRPRTFQLDAWVGHNEQGNQPTHFIAQNLDRQVSVIEYPGGDPSKARVLVGPHLFGQNDDLAPVRLRLQDVNGDGHVDLIVTVGGQNIVYINDNGQFRLLRADERAQIKL